MNVGMHQCSIVRKVCTGLVCMLLKITICRDLGSVVAVAVSCLLCLSNNLKWDHFGAGLVAAVPRMSFTFSLFLVIPQVAFGHILGGSDRSSHRPTNVSSRLPYGCCPLLALWLYWNSAMTNGCRFYWPSCTHVSVQVGCLRTLTTNVASVLKRNPTRQTMK